MAHPSANYIRYLVVKGLADGQIVDDRTRKEIREATSKHPTREDVAFSEFYQYEVDQTLIDYDLPHITEESFTYLAKRIIVPRYVQFYNLRHKQTIEFMRRERVFSIWNPAPGQTEVFNLLRQNLVKDTIKLLLMGRIPPVEISSRVSKKYNINVPVPAVEMFYEYFWNVHNVSTHEWSKHLYGSYLRDALMASLTCSPGQALYRAGFNPAINGSVSLKDLQRTLHYRLEATRMLPDTNDTASIITRLSKDLVMVHSVLYGEGAGLEETLKKFREFRMELKKMDTPAITEVAPHGNFSNSGRLVEEIVNVKQISDGEHEDE